MRRWWKFFVLPVLLLLPVLVAGCGVNMSGEPDILVKAETGQNLTVRGSLLKTADAGEPLPAGSTVELYVFDGGQNLLDQRQTLTTESGQFVFEDVNRWFNNIYLVRVIHDGLIQGEQVAMIQGDETELALDVPLIPTFDMQGTLEKDPAAGEPLPPGAEVNLFVFDERQERIGRQEITTAADGTFRFEYVPRAAGYTYLVEVMQDGLLQGRTMTRITGGEQQVDLQLQLNETLTIRGRLLQGTEDADPLPSGIAVNLVVLDETQSLIGEQQVLTGDDNTYAFEFVPRGEGYTYLLNVDYAGVPQGRPIRNVQGDEDEIEADITLYERTTDRSTVSVAQAQTLINFAPINTFGLEVRLDLTLINSGDRIVTTGQPAANAASDWPVSVRIELPPGAFGVEWDASENSSRYAFELMDETIPVVQDTWPLIPGQEHQITLYYYLPYEDSAVIDQNFNYPVLDAEVLVPNDVVTFSSDQFEDEGAFRYRATAGGLQVVPLDPDERIDPQDATLLRAYDLAETLDRDEHLIFRLRGTPGASVPVMAPQSQQTAAAQATAEARAAVTGADGSGTDDDRNLVSYVLAIMGLAVLALAGVLWWRQRDALPAVMLGADGWQPPDPAEGKDALLAAIAGLDEQYEAGDLDEAVYLARRNRVKELLIPLLDEDDTGDGDGDGDDYPAEQA